MVVGLSRRIMGTVTAGSAGAGGRGDRVFETVAVNIRRRDHQQRRTLRTAMLGIRQVQVVAEPFKQFAILIDLKQPVARRADHGDRQCELNSRVLRNLHGAPHRRHPVIA